MFNTAISFVQNNEWAEDIAQDVFIEVYQSIEKFNEQSTLGTWIYRITVNKCLDQIRAQKRQKRFAFVTSLFHKDTGELIHDTSNFEHPGILAEQKERAKYLFKTIERLPASQKTAFILSQIEGLSQKEIAEILNISTKAVESLIQRAKTTLRTKLENIYERRRK